MTYSYVVTVEQTSQVSKIYDMLVLRFAASGERASDIGFQVLNDVAAVPVACDSHVITTWCQREERALLEPLEQGTQDGRGSPLVLNLENRSPDEYRGQVASYLTKMASVFPSIARAWALLDHDPSMQLVVVNETEHNFTGVRVEVTIEGDVWAYRSAEDAQPEMPTPPREWRSGPWINMPLSSRCQR